MSIYSLKSRFTYSAAAPALYASVELRSTERCRDVLAFLLKNPHQARHVRTLVIRPNYLLPRTTEGLDAQLRVAAVRALVCGLGALHTFV